MTKIGIVGDLHIAPVPQSRIDDYFENGLNKIEQICKCCDIVIFLGDIFTQSRVEEKYLNAFIQHLLYCKNTYNVQFKTIVGNHDVVHEDEQNLQDSSLGILSCIGLMDLILPQKPLIIDNYRFLTVPVNFKRAKKYLEQFNVDNKYNNILLVHHEYETGEQSFSYNDLKDLNCCKIFFGHDHKPFDQGRIIYPEFTAYRSGSIMRNRGDEYNFTRPLYYFVLENNDVHCEPVIAQPAQEVFKIETLTRQNYNQQKFCEGLTKVISGLENNISKQTRFSIKNILVELNTPEKYFHAIQKRHEKVGEAFL